MRAPAFWWRSKPSLLANLLRPPAMAYGAIAARRLLQSGEAAGVPVVCVGNFTVGGAGKTPAALALARLLAADEQKPFFLTRGYGGRLASPVRVDPAAHSAHDVGDEPLLLARAFPTIVARDRPTGARLAARDGASVIVMDDGLQNPSLAKDLSFAVVDASSGIGNGFCLPAGPLRAPLGAQWPHVHAVLIVGEGAPAAAIAREAEARGLAVLKGRIEPDPASASRVRGRRVLAFAGIGRPEKFFATLQDCGATLARTKSFADHHRFSPAEVRAILAEAQAEDLHVVTTEKDFVRLADLATSAIGNIDALRVRLVFDDEEAVRSLARERLALQ